VLESKRENRERRGRRSFERERNGERNGNRGEEREGEREIGVKKEREREKGETRPITFSFVAQGFFCPLNIS